MSYIELNGLVPYKSKNCPALSGTCDWCPDRPGYVRTGFDHCHKHGWIRGELCDSHNSRMRKVDAGIARYSWESWMAEHFNRCPDCAEFRPVVEPEPKQLDQPKLLTRGVRLFDIIQIP
jgi:hypothetical protein